MCFADSLDIHAACMSPTINGSSVIWHLKHSDAIEIRDVTHTVNAGHNMAKA